MKTTVNRHLSSSEIPSTTAYKLAGHYQQFTQYTRYNIQPCTSNYVKDSIFMLAYNDNTYQR